MESHLKPNKRTILLANVSDLIKNLNRADFGLHLSEPEEEMELLQRLV